MSEIKERRRAAFRAAVYKAAGYRCQGPGCRVKTTANAARQVLDAHHITSRKNIAHEGYVAENGAALCSACHERAEDCEQGRAVHTGFMPDDLYKAKGITADQAKAAALRLGPDGELARKAAERR